MSEIDIPDQNPKHDKPAPNKDQKTVTAVYGTLCASFILQLTPHAGVALFSGLLLLFTWGMIAVLRRHADRESLLANHMNFLNITLWVFSALIFVAAAIGGYYIYTHYTFAQFGDLAGLMAAGDMDHPMIRELKNLTLAVGAPGYLYIVYRLAKGLRRAMGGYRIAHPKNPF